MLFLYYHTFYYYFVFFHNVSMNNGPKILYARLKLTPESDTCKEFTFIFLAAEHTLF